MKIAHRARHALIWLAYLGLACRMLIPAGYMPAPLEQGGPVILCHGGVAGQLLQNLGARPDHHSHGHGDASTGAPHGGADDGGGQHEAWEFCPVGAVLGAVALTADSGLQIVARSEPAPAAEPLVFAATPIARSYWARAPPSVPSNPI